MNLGKKKEHCSTQLPPVFLRAVWRVRFTIQINMDFFQKSYERGTSSLSLRANMILSRWRVRNSLKNYKYVFLYIFDDQSPNSQMVCTALFTVSSKVCFPFFLSLAFCRLLSNCACVEQQVKERCQKGIPPSLRGRAWLYLTGGKVKREQNSGKFQVSCEFVVPPVSIFQKIDPK